MGDIDLLWQQWNACGVMIKHPAFLETAHHVWKNSRFIANNAFAEPTWLAQLFDEGEMFTSFSASDYHAQLTKEVMPLDKKPLFLRSIRRFRRYHTVRIAWRDFAGWASDDETLGSLSDLATVCIQVTLDWLMQFFAAVDGIPEQQERLLVIALGKLGGNELNFSSDIDLLFAYLEEGETQGGRRQRSHEVYFTRLAQSFVQLLHQTTEDGFVYRVDTRLRPFGESGALVYPLTAIQDYYALHGRPWERYALMKARVVSGTEKAKQQWEALIRPFVYRRYLDYGVLADLRDLHARIVAEASQEAQRFNIKLGEGGIRELEFCVQVIQLREGGRNLGLQQPSFCAALRAFKKAGIQSAVWCDQAEKIYLFFRRVENHLQMWQDQQTHLLPVAEDDWQRLADGMCMTVSSLKAALAQRRAWVRQSLNDVMGQRMPVSSSSTVLDLTHALSGQALAEITDEACTQLFLPYYPEHASVLAVHWVKLFQTRACRNMSTTARQRLLVLLPHLCAVLVSFDALVDEVTYRVCHVIECLVQRSVYLSLLYENRQLLFRFVDALSDSEWLMHRVKQWPSVLEEVLRPDEMSLQPEALDKNVQQRLQHAKDQTAWHEALALFKLHAEVTVASLFLAGQFDYHDVSEALTALARSVISSVYNAINPGDLSFALVAYGKLGSGEMNFGSDLDLVFLYQKKEQADEQRAARVARRILNVLQVKGVAGRLYEVDTRLRPSGHAGFLVSELSAFESYQQHDAWLWEHQALVRARTVCGDPFICEQFECIRQQQLSVQRDEVQLKTEVVAMREKMYQHLAPSWKHQPGSMVDIEFISQYIVLAYAHVFPVLTQQRNTCSILKQAQRCGVLSASVSDQMIACYQRYWLHAQQRRVFDDQSEAQLASDFGVIHSIWMRFFSS